MHAVARGILKTRANAMACTPDPSMARAAAGIARIGAHRCANSIFVYAQTDYLAPCSTHAARSRGRQRRLIRGRSEQDHQIAQHERSTRADSTRERNHELPELGTLANMTRRCACTRSRSNTEALLLSSTQTARSHLRMHPRVTCRVELRAAAVEPHHPCLLRTPAFTLTNAMTCETIVKAELQAEDMTALRPAARLQARCWRQSSKQKFF